MHELNSVSSYPVQGERFTLFTVSIYLTLVRPLFAWYSSSSNTTRSAPTTFRSSSASVLHVSYSTQTTGEAKT